MRSPKGHVLRQLEGNAGDIDGQARDLVAAAGVMRSTATALRRLADGTDTISKAESMDDVRGSAGDVAPQLDKAAVRYQMTGDVLVVYARELETAQDAIGSKVVDIVDKHAAVQAARTEASSGWYADLQQPGVPARSSGEQEAADRDLETAEGELEDAWSGFDQVFGVWEEAYDRAVDGIDDAFDAADNNDPWGEDYLTALGYVGAALCVVALFCTGPVALVIGAIALAVAAAVLVITIMKRTKGRGSNADLVMAIAGMVPFVRPLATAKGAVTAVRTAKATMAGGKTALRSSLRATVRRTTRSGSRRGVPKTQTRSPGKIEKIADKKATGMLEEFSRSNSLAKRVKMNVFGGGHSDVKAFGNFIREKGASKFGAEALEWAAENAPAVLGRTKIAVFGETAGSFGVAGDFLASEHVAAYSEWRNQW